MPQGLLSAWECIQGCGQLRPLAKNNIPPKPRSHALRGNAYRGALRHTCQAKVSPSLVPTIFVGMHRLMDALRPVLIFTILIDDFRLIYFICSRRRASEYAFPRRPWERGLVVVFLCVMVSHMFALLFCSKNLINRRLAP